VTATKAEVLTTQVRLIELAEGYLRAFVHPLCR
jgi:hypothetical protein